MPNEAHVSILLQGVQLWNRWRAENPTIRPDLSESKDLIPMQVAAILTHELVHAEVGWRLTTERSSRELPGAPDLVWTNGGY